MGDGTGEARGRADEEREQARRDADELARLRAEVVSRMDELEGSLRSFTTEFRRATTQEPVSADWAPPAWKVPDRGPASSAPAEAKEKTGERDGEPAASEVAEPTQEGVAEPPENGDEPVGAEPQEGAPPNGAVAASPGSPLPLKPTLLFALGALLIAAAVAVVFVIIDERSAPPKPAQPRPEPASPRRDRAPAAALLPRALSLRGAVARDYDPDGSGGENPERARAAIDGEVRSTWTSEEYLPGKLGKRGVGLYVALLSPRRAGALELVTPTAGGHFEVYGAQEGPPQAITDPGWRRLGARKRVANRSRISLAGRRSFRYYLVWLRELPENLARMEIAEVRLFAPTPR